MPDRAQDQDIGDFHEEYADDIEEEEEVLDADEDGDSLDFWESKQRDLVTSVLDYNLKALADLIADERIDMSPRYQRRFRWDAQRQSRLIESFLMNVPIPPVFLNEDDYGVYSVIDGKQRLNAINEFMNNRLRLTGLKIFGDVNGYTISRLSRNLRNVIETRANLRAIIILRQSDPDVKFQVFQRLNTGGVRLNAQEIRNSTWPGPLNDLVLDLSVAPRFHTLLGISNPERSAIYKEMRDAEFVLRFFTFRENWDTFSGGMMRRMDEFMSTNQRLTDEALDDLRTDFMATLRAVEAAFGNKAFQRWVPERKSWRKQVLASLYDAEMFACRGRSPAKLRRAQNRILIATRKLFTDRDFRQSIDAATNTPRLFRYRIERLNEVLDSATS
jgi:Protein of unknown function DUF262